MEDVLELYAEPEDPKRPRVCFDECPYQLISETRQPLPGKPGRPQRFDYEYKREGTCNLFMFVQPHVGWRHVYEAFEPAEARRIIRKLEFHHTPKHGSWLNMAEIEFSVLAGQCLSRRLPDSATVSSQTAAWQAERNAQRATISWHFTTDKARSKLGRLYPS